LIDLNSNTASAEKLEKNTGLSGCLSFCLSLVILCSVIVYLLIFVLISAASLDKHLLFWQPVTMLYIVSSLFNLCYLAQLAK